MRELTFDEVAMVDGGSVSSDATYGAAIAVAVACVGALIAVPTMGASTALVVWGASMASSAIAIKVASD
ncbi:hypothetical protein GCM10027431_00430 [Lysobacter rhizosphaerae]